MSRLLVFVTVLGVVSLAAGPAAAQGEIGGLKSEIERLRNEVEGMRSEIRLLREFLLQRLSQPAQAPAPAAPPAPVVSTVSVATSPAIGKADARVTLVEFSDYQCPFCRRFFDQTLPAIKSQYVDSGKVRYVFRDFPIDSIHPQARGAAEAAHCAGDQGKYWEMHDLLFQNQQTLQPDHLKAHAKTLGLKSETFGECLDTGKYKERVQKNHDDGMKAGVRGTPAFFVGKTGPDGSIEGLLISGARPLADFRAEIDRLLSEAR